MITAQAILEAYPYYFELNLFLSIIWGPFIEEVLFRGYFLEILKSSWSVKASILVSSLLFTIGHKGLAEILLNGKWHYIMSVLMIFLSSVVFSAAYIRGGLLAAAIIHMFANLYFFIITKG